MFKAFKMQENNNIVINWEDPLLWIQKLNDDDGDDDDDDSEGT